MNEDTTSTCVQAVDVQEDTEKEAMAHTSTHAVDVSSTGLQVSEGKDDGAGHHLLLPAAVTMDSVSLSDSSTQAVDSHRPSSLQQLQDEMQGATAAAPVVRAADQETSSVCPQSISIKRPTTILQPQTHGKRQKADRDEQAKTKPKAGRGKQYRSKHVRALVASIKRKAVANQALAYGKH